MSVQSLTPDLMVEGVAETVEWYERVFDAEVTATLPTDADADPWWAQLRIGEASLMIQERESLTDKLPAMEGASVGGSVALYIDADDIGRRSRTYHDHLSYGRA